MDVGGVGLPLCASASSHQLQGGVERSLFDDCPLAEPSGVHAVFVAARPAFVVHVLGDGIEQSPRGAFGRFQLRPSAVTVIHAQHLG